MKYCEFCGAMGAYNRVYVQGKDFEGYFYLCTPCSEGHTMYSIEGSTRPEVLEDMAHTELSDSNGPKSGYEEKDRFDFGTLNVCNICHRKSTTGDGYGIRDGHTLPKDIAPFVPKAFKNDLWVCVPCRKKIIKNFVSSIPEINLPLFITYSGEENNATGINDLVIESVARRLRGEDLNVYPSIEEYRNDTFHVHSPVHRILNVSLDYISESDYHKLSNDMTNTKFDEAPKPNNLIVAKYEHGFYIVLYGHILTGYSPTLCKIIRTAFELRFDGILLDSNGFHFQEFESVGKAQK